MFRKYLIDIERWWQRGAVLAFFAMGLPAFIAMTGLVLELGHLYFEQADLENETEAIARKISSDIAKAKTDDAKQQQESAWQAYFAEIAANPESNPTKPRSELKKYGSQLISSSQVNGNWTNESSAEGTITSKVDNNLALLDDEIFRPDTEYAGTIGDVSNSAIDYYDDHDSYFKFTLNKNFENWFDKIFGEGDTRTATAFAMVATNSTSTVEFIPPDKSTVNLSNGLSLQTIQEKLAAADSEEKAEVITKSIDTAKANPEEYTRKVSPTNQEYNLYDRVITGNETDSAQWIWNYTTNIYLQKADNDVTIKSVPTSGRDGNTTAYIRIADDFNSGLNLQLTDDNKNSHKYRKPIVIVYEGPNNININIIFKNTSTDFDNSEIFYCTILAPSATVNISKQTNRTDYKIEGWIVAKTINNTDNIPIEYKQVQ